ncbi:hypothetical protein ASC97_04415 [Rhizobium sp. Root1203]|uniref:hypothetical protein n=1 Tax=Rhizobium sp. Root1203 TaxID=1736427 RepID=UPI00070F5F2D|nr:hypothetical protein [Rhizobium sp. Root1203]KQV27626.1 hypothetical protein ASC97_04415 [Rhizobium sp. Root1203]
MSLGTYDEIYDFAVRVYEMTHGSTCSPHFYLMTQEPPDYWPAVVKIVRQALPSGDIGHACLDEAVRFADDDIKRLRRRG